jgi:hypothetical protein
MVTFQKKKEENKITNESLAINHKREREKKRNDRCAMVAVPKKQKRKQLTAAQLAEQEAQQKEQENKRKKNMITLCPFRRTFPNLTRGTFLLFFFYI